MKPVRLRCTQSEACTRRAPAVVGLHGRLPSCPTHLFDEKTVDVPVDRLFLSSLSPFSSCFSFFCRPTSAVARCLPSLEGAGYPPHNRPRPWSILTCTKWHTRVWQAGVAWPPAGALSCGGGRMRQALGCKLHPSAWWWFCIGGGPTGASLAHRPRGCAAGLVPPRRFAPIAGLHVRAAGERPS